jgi:hypothetical protein
MKSRWIAVGIIFCVMTCTEREPVVFEFISPADSVLFSFGASDVEAVTDTIGFVIQIRENTVEELLKIKEGLIGGIFRISLEDGRHVSLSIRNVLEETTELCPHIVADINTGIWLPYKRLLVIQGSDEPQCKEAAALLTEIFAVLNADLKRSV